MYSASFSALFWQFSATDLGRDIGATPEDLAFASGLWFLIFAAMQIPVGWALDRVGPRRSSAVLLLIGGAGGAGCVRGRNDPVPCGARHGADRGRMLAGSDGILLHLCTRVSARQICHARRCDAGRGSVGNLVASYPTALAVELMGWRATLAGLAIDLCCSGCGDLADGA